MSIQNIKSWSQQCILTYILLGKMFFIWTDFLYLFSFQVLVSSSPDHFMFMLALLTLKFAKICSSVQFLPWRSWEVITGGLDSKLVMWDFSKGRPKKIVDFGIGGDAGQCCNPAFIHAVIVPDLDIVDKVGKICVIARGDGVINIINLEPETAPLKSKISTKHKMGSKSKIPKDIDSKSADQNDGNFQLDYTMGGHTSAVSSVTFSMFGEKGKFIISGGNDKSVKVWDWFKCSDAGRATSNVGDHPPCSNISLSKKVNWLCTTPSDSENLVVCDTSKIVKVYTVG